ncbi:MAG: hypothetical protein IKU36_02115 [Bacteroidales bacterium]|nr:hypothetical protein [Bacteroidales bacterium]
MKDINGLMQEALTADRFKLEEEIEDLESDLSLFTVVLEILQLTDHNGHTFEDLIFPKLGFNVDRICNIERKRDRLKDQLKAKWDEHKRICERLEEY